MKILHTSDWHLGKTLEGYSFHKEQESFLKELIQVIKKENIDLILIAGDIFQSPNPKAESLQLFYKSLKALENRPAFIIPGNHDNAVGLSAVESLVRERGIIFAKSPSDIIPPGDFNFYSIEKSAPGYVRLQIKGEPIDILFMPYPTETSLNEIISEELTEPDIQRDYSKKIGMIFEKNLHRLTEDVINIAIGHFHISGGKSTDSERDILKGGIYAVDLENLPKVQYIAMGHLHRAQKTGNAYYSGSPLQYSKSEAGQKKYVLTIDLQPRVKPVVKSIPLTINKPIEVLKAESIEEALRLTKTPSAGLTYIDLETTRVLSSEEVREMKANREILGINPIFKEAEINFEKEKTLEEDFIQFYMERKGGEPHKKVVEKFLQLFI